MTTTTLRATAAAALAALVLTGCGGDPAPSDDERREAEQAALAAVGSGRVTDVSVGDADDRYAFEVEVETDDGQDVDVELDDSYGVLDQAELDEDLAAAGGDASATPSPTPDDDTGDDTSDDTGDDTGDDAGDDTGPQTGTGRVDDDTPLRGDVRRQATRAALAEVGSGRVTEATYADRDEDHAYEVEVERGDDDVTVELDRRYRVTQVED